MQGVCKYLYRPCVLAPIFCVYVFLCMYECALCTHCIVIAQFRQKTPKSADCVYYFPRSLRRTALRGRPPAGQKRRDGQGLGHSFRPGNSRGGRGGGGDGGRVMAALVYRYYCCSCCRWCEYYHCNLQNFHGCWTNVMHLSILKADCSCLYLYSILLNTVIISNRIS